jgi:hypothetical protein
VPNQEKILNRSMCVTYHDSVGNRRMILLPNRELMQVHSHPAVDNSFCKYMEQEWELSGFQNGTILETGWSGIPVSRSVNYAHSSLQGRFVSRTVQVGPCCLPRKQPIAPSRVPRSRMPRKSLRAHLTGSLPQKNHRPRYPGFGPRSCRGLKIHTARRCAWRRQIRRPSWQSPVRKWKAVPKPPAARFFPYPAKYRDRSGKSRRAYFRRRAAHPN